MLTADEKRELVMLEMEIQRRRKQRRLFDYTPYPKQLEFHDAGSLERERLLMAGNQQGKTWSAGFETAMHLTGRYPGAGEIFYPTEAALLGTIASASGQQLEFAEGLLANLGSRGLFGADVYPEGWKGKRFDRPIKAWVGSETAGATKETVQTILVGNPEVREEWGTGAIPRADLLVDQDQMNISMLSGAADTIDTMLIKHITGGLSSCKFKQYSQGRRLWQGASIDLVWFDEEPPLDIYMEGLTRTNATAGMVYMTFTPLLGLSEVVRLFLSDEAEDLAPTDELA